MFKYFNKEKKEINNSLFHNIVAFKNKDNYDNECQEGKPNNNNMNSNHAEVNYTKLKKWTNVHQQQEQKKKKLFQQKWIY